MRIREALLLACALVVGLIAFRRESARNQATLLALVRRQRALSAAVRRLRQRDHALRQECRALLTDPYYIERVARAELGWRPAPGRRIGPSVPAGAVLVAEALPSLEPSLPQAVAPPREPTPRECLAWLGYGSVEHFQRKMMNGKPSGEIDAATAARLRALRAMVLGLGFRSVEELQRHCGLKPDGIFGRRTEQKLNELLGRRARTELAAGFGAGRRPGG